MLDILLITLSGIVSSWTVYNGILSILGVTWKPFESKNHSGITFSLIVPVKNEERVLPRLLDRLVNLEYDKSKYEIIVVEDGSTDRTFQICKEYEIKYNNLIRCYSLPRANVPNGKSRALNFALRISKGEIIGIFDGDTVPRLDILEYVEPKFEDITVGAVQGKLVPINVRESVTSRLAAIEELIYEYSIAGRAKVGLFVPIEGTCSFIRKSIIMELGGWNEYSLTEDLDISLKIVNKGCKIVYSPTTISWREVPVSLRVLIRQRLRWYRGHLEVQLGKLRKIDLRIIDGILIVLTPFFMVLNLVNYSLVLVYSSSLYIVAASLVSLASLLSLLLIILIARRHMIEYFYMIPSFVYMNFIVALNFTAIFLELIRAPRVWVKTERSAKVTGEVMG
ncbi:glycosyltransferase family 2 protein [Saccharolobus solfataricus]|uniref:Glycosyltransferase family 2 n=2 Tax=Saccharolobus solfataricus TaxID=2287 RepID=A0A0E3GT81_SACSO|nr:glycosyltransferase family 2 protein [Saccharolobus solfataricus]AKA73361.1 glycosyltransferase family 2 protein [Saccharolobus solfataricus]AKA76060.1 glycosyltransferase family 2 protein [Saccharolobus solfataricus]AKA78753.1 glycosyltransferase family 2 protein [Saccharolobus solfataricus]AZF67829.1 glycosyltransferase family 2 protein [Saccharolobus solfataricus]AZF70449.1 glycosyltransferase family 2 protein [Saccharolobus solfataricus]